MRSREVREDGTGKGRDGHGRRQRGRQAVGAGAAARAAIRSALAGRRADALAGDRRARRARPAARALAVAHRRRRSRVGRRAVRHDQGDASAGSTCCSTTPASARPGIPLEDLTFEQWQRGRRRQPDRRLPVHAGGVPADEGAEARGAAGSSTTARSRRTRRGPNSAPYTATKHAITGLTKSTSLDGRAVRHRLRPDRHRQRGDRDGRAHDERRAAGRRRDRGRAADGRRSTWRAPWSTWRACRSTPTSSS